MRCTDIFTYFFEWFVKGWYTNDVWYLVHIQDLILCRSCLVGTYDYKALNKYVQGTSQCDNSLSESELCI